MRKHFQYLNCGDLALVEHSSDGLPQGTIVRVIEKTWRGGTAKVPKYRVMPVASEPVLHTVDIFDLEHIDIAVEYNHTEFGIVVYDYLAVSRSSMTPFNQLASMRYREISLMAMMFDKNHKIEVVMAAPVPTAMVDKGKLLPALNIEATSE